MVGISTKGLRQGKGLKDAVKIADRARKGKVKD